MNFTGTSGNDTFTGTNSADTFDMSQGGNDTVNGGAGSDVFNYGGAFNELDTINGGSGTDTLNLDGNYASQFFIADGTLTSIEKLHLAAGHDYNFFTDDKIVATGKNMTVDGSDLTAANSLIFDGSSETTGHFTLEGGLGNDTLTGGAGSDIFYDRNGGNDKVFGEDGNDTFNFGAALTGADQAFGGTGTNKVNITGDYTGASALVLKTATFDDVNILHLGAGFNYDITTANQDSGALLTVDASDLTSANKLTLNASHQTSLLLDVIGSAGADSLSFGATFSSGDAIDGGAGNDTVILNGDYPGPVPIGPGVLTSVENFVLRAGHSYNFNFEAGGVASGQSLLINGTALGAGDELAIDALPLTTGSLTIEGGAGADLLSGTGHADVIDGGAGDDEIQPDGGADKISAGTGNDFIGYFGNFFTPDASINGGAGNDQLALDGDYSAGVTFHSATMTSIEDLAVDGDFSYNLKLADANIASGGSLQVDSDYTTASDSLTLNDDAETNATLTFNGGMGDDVVTVGGGKHILNGGDGNDTFKMLGNFTAADNIDGGDGNDLVLLNGDYSAGVTFAVSTMQNVDTIRLTAGHSYKLTTVDATVASGHLLTVDGSGLGAGDSLTFIGTAETDGMFAIAGGAGNDMLVGGAGNDTFTGGGGADTIQGHAGADIFVYGAATDSTSTHYDTINGADMAVCKFDLSFSVTGIDATVTGGTLSTASFDSDLAAAVGAGRLAVDHAVLFTPNAGTLAGDTFLIVDANGTAGYQAGDDLVISLNNAMHLSSLAVGNFI